MSHGLGWRSDPRDRRDKGAGQLLGAGAPPLTGSVRHPYVEPRNQGGSNSCVGFAWAQAVQIAYLARGLSCPQLSALFTYFLARATHSETPRDNGTHIRAAAKATRRLGLATEECWRFSRLRVNKPPSMRAQHDGYVRRGLRGYYAIPRGDLDGIRRAISSGFPVVFGVTVGGPFQRLGRHEVVESLSGPAVGGHAMVVESYDENSFTWLNSWGTRWGNAGRCTVTEDVMATCRDLWVIDVENG